jgi:NADPH2:quinone reductase
VRIAIKAASLNFPDLLIVRGKYQFKPPLALCAGRRIRRHGGRRGRRREQPARRHAGGRLAGTGGFGTHAIVNASRVLPLPPGFALEDAAAFAFTYGTSHHALVDRAQLKAGETVLVLGAAGGVGTAALQIAKAVGARVIAAASSDEKCALCRELGADATINYTTQNLRDAQVPDRRQGPRRGLRPRGR